MTATSWPEIYQLQDENKQLRMENERLKKRKSMTKRQEMDATECEEMQSQGKDKDCLGCSCNVCIAGGVD